MRYLYRVPPTCCPVRRAIKTVRVFGDGFGVVKVGRDTMVKSLPVELNSDHTDALRMAGDVQGGGVCLCVPPYFTDSMFCSAQP
jgi:hypothetical protein